MLLSELLQNHNINAQLFAFFNTRFLQNENFKTKFCIRSFYKQSKFITLVESQKAEFARQTNENLCLFSSLPFEYKNFGTHKVLVENDLKFSIDEYINALYANILRLRQSGDDNDFEKALLTAIFVLNGSVDFNHQYYATDIHIDLCTQNYFKKFFMLILNVNSRFLNLNFRELQAQFVRGENKRNAQIRVNLAYFCQNSHTLNPFKTAILQHNKNKIAPLTQSPKSTIFERAELYLTQILGKKAISTQQLRQRLDFDKDEINKISIGRNVEIVRIAGAVLEDKCVACCDDYDIKDRTFKRRNGAFYLEIHHNIPYSYDKNQCDVIENLVKLCPVCHKALSKNSSSEDYQKSLIASILSHSQEAKNFAQIISQANNDSDLINFIYETLA